VTPVFVACSQCGFENDPQHHFCGMCGEPLRAPYAAPVPPNKPIPGISGPSVLGLGSQEPSSRSVDYLLEEDDDEPSRGHPLLYVSLAVLVAVVAVVAWRWREGGYPWEARVSGQPAASNPAAPAPQPSAPEPAAAAASTAAPPAGANPAAAAPSSTPAASPDGSAASAAPAPSAESGSNAASASPATAQKQSPPDSDQAKPEEPKAAEAKASPETAESKSARPAKHAPAPLVRKVPAPADDSADDDTEADDAAPAPPPARKAAKPDPRQGARASAAPADPTDAWVADGQRYLYGNGVPQDCRRAKAQLLAAAARSNPQAQSTLGTMYATGHCVDRDLISAYRWFAQALQKDRTNTRIQQDLQVLWNQMTPQEKQTALQTKH